MLRQGVRNVFFAMALSDNESSCQFFAKLYIKHRGLMYGTAMKLVHDPAVAEDIVHDAIVRLIDKEETLVSLDCCSLKTYIVYTIRSLSLNYLRKQSKERLRTVEIDPECEDTAFIDRSPRPEEVLLMKEQREKLAKIWEALPESTKDLLAGKYILGLTDRELAETFGCSPDSIRMKLTRARRLVLEKIREGDFNFEPA